jgi:heme/copper-type cytochrome/quinol oxidase subunit 2
MPVQYGDPSSGSAMPPPAPPYDAAGNAQPAYPQAGPMPGVPGAPGAPGAPTEPGKGMAITALVLSFICCLDVVGMILAIVVLVRSRDGQNRGKGLAIAALIVGFITLVITIVLVVAGVSYVKDFKDVNDLKAGDCITAHGLTDKNADTIDQIRSVSCSSKHDGEVLATTSVTADLAKDISKMDPQATCAPAIEAAGKSAAVTDSVNVTALTVATPKTGDNIACVAYHADGSKLTGKLG